MNIKFDFKWDKSFDAKMLNAISKGVEAGCQEVERRAKANCPVGDVAGGGLKNSITREVKGTRGRVYTDKEYARHVEFGTRPHIIKVKNAKVLSDGSKIFGKTVKHPGFKGRFFMRKALYENWGKIQNIVKRVMKMNYEILST